MIKKITITLLAFFVLSNIYAQTTAQWRGPNRDGIYNETGLLKFWSADGPKLVWHYDELGDGHTSAAISGDIVYITGLVKDKGYIYALDKTGKLLWKKEYGDEWSESWPGSRTTPLIHDGKLYLMSGFGKVVCLSAANGDIIWTEDLIKTYGARNLRFGMTENLLIDGDKLFCTVGGSENCIIALNKKDGKLIWTSAANGQKSAYCSPLLITAGNKKILVTHLASSIVGIDSENGILLWQLDYPNQYSIHPNTPIYKDGYLYCFTGYGKGGVMLKVSDDGSKIAEMWRDSLIDSRTGSAVLYNGMVYGSGDFNKMWHVIDWKTGKKISSEKLLPKTGNIILADGMLYCLDEAHEVALVEPREDGFKKISSFKAPFGSAKYPSWAHLVIDKGLLYVRFANSLMVYDIKK